MKEYDKNIKEIIKLLNNAEFPFAEKNSYELLKFYPNDTNILHFLSISLFRQNKNEKALEFLNKALSIDNKNHAFLLTKGSILRQQNKIDHALIIYDELIEMKPDFWQAYFNRGNLLSEIKRYKESIVDYNNVL